MASRRTNTTTLGLEASLWDAANRLRSNVEPSEYKHVVLGLLFLKYVSDKFEARREVLERQFSDPSSDSYLPSADARMMMLEDRDSYTAEGVFWVPEGHRWEDLRKAGKQSDIGRRINEAMEAIEKENPSLKGILPKDFNKAEIAPHVLGGLIDTFSREDLARAEHENEDILGRVYEYMLGRYAFDEGKSGGEFYTPRSVVSLLVEMIRPYRGRIYDPCCGSGGMFVQAEKFVEAHSGHRNDLAVYGQEMNPTTWRLAQMNLAIRGIEANLGPVWGDSFSDDKHPDLRADFILANPPFNISQWGGERLTEDKRWAYGVPPAGNANYAWLQHMLHHLSPTGTMAVVLANGSVTVNSSNQGEIRKRMVEDDVVECVVALPSQLFYSVPISVSVWFLTKDKSSKKVRTEDPQRDRRGEVLFIDARNVGYMESRTQRNLSPEDIAKVADSYNAWRGDPLLQPYMDVPGFCASVTTRAVADAGYALSPGRYVGAEEVEDDGVPVEETIARLSEEIREGFSARADLQSTIEKVLDQLEVGE